MARQLPDDLSLLARLYERWEPQEDKRRHISDDLKELFGEGKGEGFNPKAMRKAFAERYRLDHQTAEQREKAEATDDETELYLSALARVRESADEPDHSPDAGNMVDPSLQNPQTTQPATDPKQVTAAAPAGEGAHNPTSSADPIQPETATSGEASEEGAAAGESPADSHAGGENVAERGAYEPPSNVTELRPAKKQWKHSDPAHRDCLNPSGCGGFSNLGLCPQCKEAAAGGQVA